jgi:hypothetical protein
MGSCFDTIKVQLPKAKLLLLMSVVLVVVLMTSPLLFSLGQTIRNNQKTGSKGCLGVNKVYCFVRFVVLLYSF